MTVCVCVCVCMCVRTRVRACVRTRVRARALIDMLYMYMYTGVHWYCKLLSLLLNPAENEGEGLKEVTALTIYYLILLKMKERD